MSTLSYAAPVLVVNQPFQESTPKHLVVNYSTTNNPITIKYPFPIDQMDSMIIKEAGKKLKLVDIKYNFKTKENFVVIFGLTNTLALFASHFHCIQ